MLNEASLTDVMEPVGAIFLSRTALKEKLFHSGGLMQDGDLLIRVLLHKFETYSILIT